MSAVKSSFRKIVSCTPVPAHKMMTKLIVRNITKHVMSDEETRKCEKK